MLLNIEETINYSETPENGGSNDRGWNLVIGIEIHAQVNSKSKLFSSSPTDFGSKPIVK